MSRPSPWLLPILVLCAGLVALGWWWAGRMQQAGPAPPGAMLNSVSFAPFRPGQSPLAESFPSAAEVDADMALVAGRSRAIRTYAAREGDYDVAALAQRHGLKLWLGIWLGADRVRNAAEIARGIDLANRWPETVERVIVGNEVLLRRDLPVAELTAAIDRVRAAVRQKVTYADVWEFWQQFPEVARHVDIVTIHLLPYWEDDPAGIDRAIAHVHDVWRRMARQFADKPIAIGEAGWPSAGRARRDATPSRVNQVRFLRQFVALARQEGFDYNLIEAFDQVWKYQSEGTVGANWGLWTADREPKFPASGPVSDHPGWRAAAGSSVAIGLALLAGVLAGYRAGPGVQARLAVLSLALGAALAFAWQGTVPVAYDVWLRVAAAGNLGGQALLAALLLRRAAAILTGAPVPPPRTGGQATMTVRDLLLLRRVREHLLAWRCWLFDDLCFVFVWTAAVLQLLLLFDPRYRDFPLPVFAVPLVAVVTRALLRDLPSGGGAREEAWAGGVLALGALASAAAEGPLNSQSLAWNAAALVLAAPPLLRVLRPVRARAPGIA